MSRVRNVFVVVFVATIVILVILSFGDVTKVKLETPVSTELIFSANEDEITSFDVKNQTGKFSVERCEEIVEREDREPVINVDYRLYGNHDMKLSQKNVRKFLSDFTEFHVKSVVADNLSEKNLKKYGFTDDEVFVQINLRDEETHKFILGGTSPDGKERYLIKSGNEKIYSIVSLKESAFLNDLESYRERRIGTLDGNTLLSFSVTDKGVRKMGIRYKNIDEREVVTIDMMTYVMVLPYNGPVNIDRFGELMSNFDEVYAEDFVEDNPTDLSKYGLDEHSSVRAVIQDSEGGVHDLNFGKTDEAGNVYTMYQGNDFVFTTNPKMYNAVKDINPAEFIDKYTNIFRISDVRKVTLEKGEKKFVLEIMPSGAAKYRINGKEALDRAFKAVYDGIAGIIVENTAEEEKKEEKVLDITFRLKSGVTKKSEFYEYDSKYYGAVTTEGEYGLVSKRFVDNLMEIIEVFDEKPHLEP